MCQVLRKEVPIRTFLVSGFLVGHFLLFSLLSFTPTFAEFGLWGILIFLEKLKEMNAAGKEPFCWSTPSGGRHFGNTKGAQAPPSISDKFTRCSLAGAGLAWDQQCPSSDTCKEIIDLQNLGQRSARFLHLDHVMVCPELGLPLVKLPTIPQCSQAASQGIIMTGSGTVGRHE